MCVERCPLFDRRERCARSGSRALPYARCRCAMRSRALPLPRCRPRAAALPRFPFPYRVAHASLGCPETGRNRARPSASAHRVFRLPCGRLARADARCCACRA